jgi:hypothetical protein
MYSASAVDIATEFYFFEAQDNIYLPINWQGHDALFVYTLDLV